VYAFSAAAVAVADVLEQSAMLSFSYSSSLVQLYTPPMSTRTPILALMSAALTMTPGISRRHRPKFPSSRCSAGLVPRHLMTHKDNEI